MLHQFNQEVEKPQIGKEFLNQMRRLVQAGYPPTLLSSVAEAMLTEKEKRTRDKDKKIAVIPYAEGISHNLRR